MALSGPSLNSTYFHLWLFSYYTVIRLNFFSSAVSESHEAGPCVLVHHDVLCLEENRLSVSVHGMNE